MSSKLIELSDGLMVEVEAREDSGMAHPISAHPISAHPIGAGCAEQVEGSLAAVEPLLLKAVQPVVSVQCAKVRFPQRRLLKSQQCQPDSDQRCRIYSNRSGLGKPVSSSPASR